jgi:hypothetical protein
MSRAEGEQGRESRNYAYVCAVPVRCGQSKTDGRSGRGRAESGVLRARPPSSLRCANAQPESGEGRWPGAGHTTHQGTARAR